jgi:pimeloyl-ACP methyl ester carboxylesterase
MTVDNTNESNRSGGAAVTEERVHRAVSADGTEISGRVQGQGPPLVLVHGGFGNGEVAWETLLPHLTDRFTRPRAWKKTSPHSSTASANRSVWWAGRAAARGSSVRPRTAAP